MKKVILFDLDGTLVDSIGIMLDGFRNMFFELKQPYPGNEYMTSLIGKGFEEILPEFFPNDMIETAIATYRKYYLQSQQKGIIKFFPGVREELISLRNEGFTLGIVTSKFRIFSEQILGQLEANEYFSVIIGGEDVNNKKPHPEPLHLATKTLGISAEQCMYVGDSVYDAESAKNAGVRFVGVLTGAASRETLAPYGEVFISIPEAHKNQAFEDS